jgi:TIR domain
MSELASAHRLVPARPSIDGYANSKVGDPKVPSRTTDSIKVERRVRKESVRFSSSLAFYWPFAVWAGIAAASLIIAFRQEIAALLGWIGGSIFHGSATFLPNAPPEDNVDVVVFAPQSAEPGETFLVQVFLGSVVADEARLKTEALASDPTTTKRGVTTLLVELSYRDRVDIKVDGVGLVVRDETQTIEWRGRSETRGFLVTVPDTFIHSRAAVQVHIYREFVPIGRISFAIAIGLPSSRKSSPVGDFSRMYSRAFLSYASSDRSEVISRAQAIRAANIKFFLDILSLDPEERWERKLYREIEECDLFLLFWSRAAQNSEWVNKEIEYALDCINNCANPEAARPEIKPILIEGPPPPEPPKSLSHLHFNDPFLYVIGAQTSSPKSM